MKITKRENEEIIEEMEEKLTEIRERKFTVIVTITRMQTLKNNDTQAHTYSGLSSNKKMKTSTRK